MKSLKLCCAAVVLVAMSMLTSCLNGDNVTSGVAYGIVEYSMDAFRNVVVVDDKGTSVSAPEFDNLNEGDCVGFVYKIDYDNQVSNKYITASVSDHIVFDKWNSNSYVDTTFNTMTSSELALKQVYSLQYVKGYLFANIVFPNIAEDQKNNYTISYDLNQTPDKNMNGNVYKLYVRSSLLEQGVKTPREAGVVNTFYLRPFFDRIFEMERANGKEFVQFKYVFVDQLDVDKKYAHWGESEVSVLAVPRKSEPNMGH